MTQTETTVSKHHAKGVLAQSDGETIVLAVPETSYQLRLVVLKAPGTALGKKISGVIRVQARRIDKVGSGGRYIEPVAGRPRRVQGSVLSVNASDGTFVMSAGVPVVVKPMDARQKASDFAPGDFVSFDALPGATFTPAG